MYGCSLEATHTHTQFVFEDPQIHHNAYLLNKSMDLMQTVVFWV